MLETIIVIVVALCLIGTVIWAFDHYVTIPGPFAWAKGLVIFIMIVVACYLVWDYFVSHGSGHLGGHLRL
jgi:hypothetical protein